MLKRNELDYLTDAEVKALLSAVDNPRDLAIILLCLDAGVRLKELPALDIDSVDWEKRILRITGWRPRNIPIDDRLYAALSAWSRERDNTSSEAFFTHLKGERARMASRGIAKRLTAYGKKAGIGKPINAHILRNTFAVRLFSRETSIDKVSYLLGTFDPASIKRYIKFAGLKIDEDKLSKEIEKLDERPRFVRLMSNIFRKEPKKAKIVEKPPPSPAGEAGETTFGRDEVLSHIRANLSKEISTLLTGDLGIGKTHILLEITKELSADQGAGVLYLDSPVSVKQMLGKICERFCPDWLDRLPNRTKSSAGEILDLLKTVMSEREQSDVLVIDNLDMLKISDSRMVLPLFDLFTILSAAQDTPARLKELWWKFRKIELGPLSSEASKELIRYLTKDLTVTDYLMLETRIMTYANGYPVAIVEMIDQIKHLSVVRDDDIRALTHEAGVRYRDWTPLLIIIWTIATSSRFIALGFQSVEGYIFAVIGMAALTYAIRVLRTR